MVTLFISALVVILLVSAASIWLIDSAHRSTIAALQSDNKDLRDRLFQSKGFAPSGINVTEQYIEKKEAQKEQKQETTPSRRKKVLGPIEQITEKWTKKDKKLADRGIQIT